MSDTVIRAENISKKYVLGGSAHTDGGLRYVLNEMAAAPLRKLRQLRSGQRQNQGNVTHRLDFWALKDVSFDIKHGEVVGIIGRNGAGKSTLLKILSRITEPTKGRVGLKGRVASLLEVGTGFHHELTGRENIFLNGAILGMSRAEIRRKFDEIVEFAGVDEFLDTPVKRYSSGMYVRLAFSVAAHLEPEILIIDEVLAVGDANFQRKCLDKMQDVGQQGRTVIFVSHNMPAVTRLCQRTILLDSGTILHDGPSHQVVSSYLRSGLGTTAKREWRDRERSPGNEIVRLYAVRVITEDENLAEVVDIRKPVIIEMEYEVLKTGAVLAPSFNIINEEGILLFVTLDSDCHWKNKPRPAEIFVSRMLIPGNFLSEGTYVVEAAISNLTTVTVHFHERDAVAFQVVDTMDGDSARREYAGAMPGVVRPLLKWATTSLSSGENDTASTRKQRA